ncbi:MAG: efflux RND transporter permease subunit [Gammaproteobacteria bacterium]|nr:efflux RND transporter permease subunit [Gammaproteobacteria bacterium]
MSKFFIDRPVLANVIALLFILIGLVALYAIPVSQYPPIVPPTIAVTANYPGADAKTLINTVALPIEQQINGVEGMLYMQSTSTNTGNYSLVVTFEIGSNLNYNQVLVQNRVQAALAQLPESVQQQGVMVQQKSTAILQFITLTAKNGEYDGLFLNNYAAINMQNELARIPGVGNVLVFGSGEYAMRIWLDPGKMQQYALMPSDVINAIKNQNKEVAAGQLGATPANTGQSTQLTVNVPGQLADVTQFENIIVKSQAPSSTDQSSTTSPNGQVVRIKDVGHVELGSSSYKQIAQFDQKPTAAIGIFQLPGANALDVAQAVRDSVAKMAKSFPPGMEYHIPFDTTIFVKASVEEVYKTLFEAGILVLLVIVVFLQNFRAILVPATTVPVTIIGAFAAMAALGYSVNLLTLFGLVLAIGIVVDDAIVVVEGVTQYIERGMEPKQASIEAMKHLQGPILGITLVLMAVFIPAGFLPGLTGQMYAQFALVIAATALISAINAMTLKPTQCALWLKSIDHNAKKNRFFRAFDRFYNSLESRYVAMIERMVHKSGQYSIIAGILVVIAIIGFARVPTGFVPLEDQGYMMMSVLLPDSASLERTNNTLNRLTAETLKVPGVKDAIAITGISLLDSNAALPNAGVIYIMLEDWSVRGRKLGLLPMYTALNKVASQEKNAKVLVAVPPPIQGLGLSGGVQMQVELTDGSFDYRKLQQATDSIVKYSLETQPAVQRMLTSFRAEVPQVSAPIDRTKAEAMGVSIGDAFDTLQSYLGSSYVNLFNKFGQVFSVYVQASTDTRMTAEQMRNYAVRNSNGDMVPLGTMTDLQPVVGPALIPLYNLYPSASIVGMAAKGYSAGQAMDSMEKAADYILPAGMTYEWTSTAYQQILAGNATYYIFALALILVYLVLAGQYESWITPAAVLCSIPLALLGTTIVLTLLAPLGMSNDIYTQIGVVLLIALAAKNAILIVEVARIEHEMNGKTVMEAAVLGAKTRFRPILMTSFAFIMGVLPLVFSSGAGANARRSIGLAVCSGMLSSTGLAVIFVPTFYVFFQTLHVKYKEKQAAKKLSQA